MKLATKATNKFNSHTLVPAIFIILFIIVGGYLIINSKAAVTCASSLSADIDCDSRVNITDLSILLTNYGKTTAQLTSSTPSYPRADINNSSKVDIGDLSALLTQYGQFVGVSCSPTTKALKVNLAGYSTSAPYLNQGSYPDYAALDACGYPSPNTAGVPAGTNLVNLTSSNAPANTLWSGGSLWVNGAATINGYNIAGSVVINTNSKVTITNSQIRWGGDGAVIGGNNTAGFNPNLTVSYSTVGGVYDGNGNCTNPSATDIRLFYGNVVMDHDKFDCSFESVNDDGGNSVKYTLTHSYVIADGYGPGAHMEALYLGGSINVEVDHNTILAPLQPSATIFNDSKCGLPTKLLVTNNLIAGGIGNGAFAGGGPNATVTGNRFSGAWGNTDWGAQPAGTVWSGNYVDGTGAIVNVNYQPLIGC